MWFGLSYFASFLVNAFLKNDVVFISVAPFQIPLKGHSYKHYYDISKLELSI